MAAPLTDLDICTRAVRQCHSMDAIASLTAPVGKATVLCATFYDDARREVLRMGSWTCVTLRLALTKDAWAASTVQALGDQIYADGAVWECTTAGTTGASAPTWPTPPTLTVNDNGVVWTFVYLILATPGDNYTGYEYAFAVPADYINQIEVTDENALAVNFLLEAGVLYTDCDAPIFVYIPDADDVTVWDPLLAGAVVMYLASKVAYPLTGSHEDEQAFAQSGAAIIAAAAQKTQREKRQGPGPSEPWMPDLFPNRNRR